MSNKLSQRLMPLEPFCLAGALILLLIIFQSSVFAQQRVINGQLALYAFAETGGNTVHDSSGVGTPLDLTIADPGAVTWLAGGGLSIDSPTVISSIDPASKVLTAVQDSQALSIEAWVRPDNTTQSGPARIVALSKNGHPDGANFILGQSQTDYTARLRTTATDDKGRPSLDTSTDLATTGLTHVVYTRDTAGVTHLYVNGIEEANGVVAGDFSNWEDYALALVNEPELDNRGQGRPWLGELHLVALYDRALDVAEVNINFVAGLDQSEMDPMITLAWDASPESVGGYYLYYGEISQYYTSQIDVGNQTIYTLFGLEEGINYYAVVTAYDVTRTQESATSNEISFTTTISTAIQAQFSVSATSGIVPLEVAFIDTSTGNISSWFWDFGDGSTSELQAPTKTFTAPGEYTVSLTVSDSDSSDTTTTVISVTAMPPTADFSANPVSGTAPLLVNFTDTSTGEIASWQWDFGDGTTSQSQSAIKSYEDPGLYTVSLTVTGSGGSDTVTQTNLIVVELASPLAPLADFSASPRSGQASLTVAFADTSENNVTSWSWDFGDGNSSSTQHPTFTYTEPGTYTVTLTVTGAGGSDTKTETAYISVYEDSDSERITDGQLLLYTFTEETGGTVRDISGVGTPLDLTIADPGAVTWLAGGGLSIDSPTVISSIDPASKVLTAVQDSQALSIEAWVRPDNTTQSGPARIVALSKNGHPDGANFILGQSQTDYTARLRTTATDDKGRPSLDTSTDLATTGLTHVVYTRDTAGVTHLYVNGIEEANGVVAGDFSNWEDYALALVNEPELDNRGQGRPWLGELHLVALYDRALDVAEVNINFVAGPGVVLSEETIQAQFSVSATSGIVPLEVAFIDTSTGNISSWFWDFGDGSTSELQAPTKTFTAPGEYTVSLTVSDSDSSDTTTTVISVTAMPPTADFSANPVSGTAPLLVNFTDTSTGEIASWQWDFGDGTTSQSQSAIKSYEDPGLYTVSLTVTGSGGSDTVTQTNLIVVELASPLAPLADFSASPRSGQASLTVAFADTSENNVTSWSWDFGDGNSSSTQHPTFTYTEPGTYTVTLTVTGAGGSDTKTETAYISVYEDSDSERITDGQLLLYTFTEETGGTVRDISGVGTPLDLTIADPGAVTWLAGGGLSIDSPTVISSIDPASKVLTAVQDSQALSIEAWVRPDNTTQSGPARIVALSKNGHPDGANFILGQSQTDYTARLRTTATDDKGRPSLDTSTDLATTGLTHVVYTRDTAGVTHLYVNGIEEANGVVAGDFSNWEDYALALVNEPELDNNGNGRPWLGELHLVALYDRALDVAEVNINFVAGPGVVLSEEAFLQTGEIQVNHQWQRVNFRQSFTAPVVVAKSLSSNDPEPAVVRIRNVDASGFDIRVQEWDYLDDEHGWEQIGYIVMEAGSHTLEDGIKVEAGHAELPNTRYRTVTFNQAFPTAPVVFSSVISVNETDAVTTRMRRITSDRFNIRMLEQQSTRHTHSTESVAYIAWEISTGVVDGIAFEVNRTGDSVTHANSTIQYTVPFLNTPAIIADMQTSDSGDVANLRWTSKNQSSVTVNVAEEQSYDTEISHTTEVVGYMLFSDLEQ